MNKWDPANPQCVFQTYFYNQVNEEHAPYYSPGPDEDESKWEEALKNKPSAGSIPVIARGPYQVGKRMETQWIWLQGIRSRLHELNEKLTARLQAHDLQYTARTEEARRKHILLSRRCLSLAGKVQMLRSRGYALEGAEEQLKTKLLALERTAYDPVLSGQQEEIWARMSVLRERAQLLKNETEKLAREAAGKADNPLDDEQMRRIEKVCNITDTGRILV